jgi:hypothetical protein
VDVPSPGVGCVFSLSLECFDAHPAESDTIKATTDGTDMTNKERAFVFMVPRHEALGMPRAGRAKASSRAARMRGITRLIQPLLSQCGDRGPRARDVEPAG